MGEAKRRNRNQLRRLQEEQPYCIFCGRETMGTTVDHVPPIGIFSQRQRPQGMEFLACQPCNGGTRAVDQAMAMFSRIFPNAETDAEQAETRQVILRLNNNWPALVREIMPSFRQRKLFRRAGFPDKEVAVLNAGGPLLTQAMNTFGAKLGMALHFHSTGRIVPAVGGVAVRWFSNHEAWTGQIPEDFVSRLGPRQTLRQGKKDVGEQFSYASVVAEGEGMSAHWATFRVSFAMALFVSEDITNMETIPERSIMRPGCLQAPPDAEIHSAPVPCLT